MYSDKYAGLDRLRLQALKGRHVLVVEDEYRLAEDLSTSLTDLGAVALGPIGAVEDGLALLASMQVIDAAVLDLNLRGEVWILNPI